jgi:uncharacterized protein YqeY
MVKQRKESAEIYTSQGRADLAEGELAEIAAIEGYLPAQMSEEELEKVIGGIIAETGASGVKDMGKVIGASNKALAGKAEGKLIADVVKRLLSNI